MITTFPVLSSHMWVVAALLSEALSVLYVLVIFPPNFTWVLWKTEPKAGLMCRPRAVGVRETGSKTDAW